MIVHLNKKKKKITSDTNTAFAELVYFVFLLLQSVYVWLSFPCTNEFCACSGLIYSSLLPAPPLYWLLHRCTNWVGVTGCESLTSLGSISFKAAGQVLELHPNLYSHHSILLKGLYVKIRRFKAYLIKSRASFITKAFFFFFVKRALIDASKWAYSWYGTLDVQLLHL